MISCTVDRDAPYIGWTSPLQRKKFQYYRFEVCLAGAKPKIFRVFSLPIEASFFDLHTAIQLACGWSDSHNYLFQNEDGDSVARPCPPFCEEAAENDTNNNTPTDTALKLNKYFHHWEKQKCFYLYDLHDQWLHTITLERFFTEDREFVRELLDGARSFPLENCGGIRGYEELVTLKETGKIPDSTSWDDAPNIIELIEEPTQNIVFY
jgi:hypothetical protein